MPCDSIQLNRVDIATLHPSILAGVERQLDAEWEITYVSEDRTWLQMRSNVSGYRVTYERGQLTSTGSDRVLASARNALSRGYAKAAVYAQARKLGAKVRQIGASQYEVVL